MVTVVVRLADLEFLSPHDLRGGLSAAGMCLMHAGFQRIATDHDTGMNLDEPFLTALELHKNGKGDTDAN